MSDWRGAPSQAPLIFPRLSHLTNTEHAQSNLFLPHVSLPNDDFELQIAYECVDDCQKSSVFMCYNFFFF